MASHGIARTARVRSDQQRQQDLDKIQKYRSLEDQLRQQAADKLYGSDTFQLTSKLLRLNPEYYTVWNVRRRCLISGLLSKPSDGSWPSTALPTSSANATPTPSSAVSSPSSSTETPPAPGSQTTGTSGTTHDPPTGPDEQNDLDRDVDVIRSELAFTIPLLMEFPKCYWIWNYRIWILGQATDRLRVTVARKIWEEELGLVSKMLHRDRRNFHAWTYRRHVVEQLESSALEGSSMAAPEFEYTTKMIHMDLSNFSAWHNRSRLIPRLLDERKADYESRKKLLEDELVFVDDALNVGPEDQSLWYYHQFLISNLVGQGSYATFVPDLTAKERIEYITREIEGIKELLEDYQNIKWIYEALIEYTLAVAQLGNTHGKEERTADLAEWLHKVKVLDPKRSGRWKDFERGLSLA